MNEKQCIEVCKILNLGSPLSVPSKVLGGLIHHMWRIDTDKGVYAIKQLSKHILLTPQVREQYEITEKIAKEFKRQGMPAITSIEQKNGKSLIDVENDTFIAYPWVEAHALCPSKITRDQANIIAGLLARMHQMHLDVPEILMPVYTIESNDRIQRLNEKSRELNLPFSHALAESLDMLVRINTQYETIIPLLQKNEVMSHGDLDPKNVLWNADHQPFLVDWESARLLNPTQEILNAALDWGGIATGALSWEIFRSMLEAYQKAGGVLRMDELEAALIAISGNWINWLLFNIERSISLAGSSSSEYQERIEQVNQTVRTILLLENNKAALLSTGVL